MMAVVPSGPAAFGFAFWASNFSAVARSPASAASSSVGPAATAAEAAASKPASATVRTVSLRILDLRIKTSAVPDGFHRDIVAIEQRHQQVGETGILRILQMLAALDLPVRMAEQSRRQ